MMTVIAAARRTDKFLGFYTRIFEIYNFAVQSFCHSAHNRIARDCHYGYIAGGDECQRQERQNGFGANAMVYFLEIGIGVN